MSHGIVKDVGIHSNAIVDQGYIRIVIWPKFNIYSFSLR
ncbi:hypothetical protein ALP71_00591 [Pseudomonas coronafaciens pv. garcae]|nr:hypothetical protein ALP71_00591 [Pseudomonas coronafaciens pv. garcae]